VNGPVPTILVSIIVTIVVVTAVIFLIVPLFKGLGWIFRQLFRFIGGELVDAARLVGSLIVSIIYVPLIFVNLIIGRWSAMSHFGRAFQAEIKTAGLCVYRMVIGHPLKLVGLGGVLEGVENRLPEVVAAAPTSDKPKGKAGLFEGYTIVGSLAAGGSGAKLYVANPDALKLAAFQRMGFGEVGQVVIKTFSMKDGSSLSQIVRESRSLDAAKRMGLILDHELAAERFYYVMRYVPGESLSMATKAMHGNSPADGLSTQELRRGLGYVSDLVATLATYHRGGLWHKDVKPDNIIVDAKTGKATLVDFGLVSSLRSAMTLTTHGTEYFRDPELVRLALKGVKVQDVDGTKFDIYAAGAVLFSMLEDSFPAHGVLSQLSKKCPEAVKWVIRRAMTDYDKRYATADMMLADLEHVRSASDPFAVKPFELPSMRGDAGLLDSQAPFVSPRDVAGNPVDEPVRVGPAAASPMPGVGVGAAIGGAAVGAAASVAGVGRPKIRVTNWWKGHASVDGHEAAPAGRDGSPEAKDWAGWAANIAEKSAQAARAAVDAAIGDGRGGAAAGGAAADRARARRYVAPEQRRTAREQVEAARARVRARRDAAHARLGGLRTGAKRQYDNGINPGAAVAIVLVLVGAGSFLVKKADRQSSTRNSETTTVIDDGSFKEEASAEMPVPPVPPTPLALSPRAIRNTFAGVEDQWKVTIQQASEQVSKAMQVAMEATRQDVLNRSTMRTRLKNLETSPARSGAPIGRVLVITDILQPWSAGVQTRMNSLVESLKAEGLMVLGNVPGVAVDEADAAAQVEVIANARLSLGQTPVDSDDARVEFSRWLVKNHTTADVLVWIAPALKKGEENPRLFLFVPQTAPADDAPKMQRIQDATGRALGMSR
jgi:serine/threonine protein kinase